MKRFDQNSATCQIFTYKEGLFSTLAHDLLINVTSFVIEITDDNGSIESTFDAGSLRVDCVIADGKKRRDILSAADMKEIDNNTFKDVLNAATFKSASFSSTSVARENSSYRVNGILFLHGKNREIQFTVGKEGNCHVTEVRLHLPDFGIKPFSALFGAMKVKPDVLIQITVPVKNTGVNGGLNNHQML